MLLLVPIVGLFLALRFFNLNIIPVFADEAIYIRWAQLVLKGKYFIPLSDGKTPLFMWLLTSLLKIIGNPLFAGRFLSIIAGLATLFGIYFITKKLFNKKTAVIAASLTIFQPFLLFYDRLSLVDSLLTSLIIWSFYFGLKLFQQPKIKTSIILGLLWAASLLTKPAAALFILLTPSLLLISSKNLIEKIKKLIFPGIVASVLALSIYSLQRLSNAFHMINSRSADYLRTSTEIFSSWFEFFPDTFSIYLSWINNYLTWPALILLIISWGLSIKYKQKRIFILSLWIAIPVVVQASIGKIIYPRYLLPIIPFIIIILSWGITKMKKPILIPLIILTALFWLRFDYLLLTDPIKAPLNQWEKNQYFNNWSAGYGLSEITKYLKQLPKDKKILVATEGSFGTLPNGLEIFFDQSKNIHIQGIGFPKIKINQDMENSLAEDKLVFLVFNKDRIGDYNKNRLELIEQYPRPQGETLLFFKVLPKNN